MRYWNGLVVQGNPEEPLCTFCGDPAKIELVKRVAPQYDFQTVESTNIFACLEHLWESLHIDNLSERQSTCD